MCMYGAGKVDGLPDDIHYLCNSGVVIKSLRDLGHAISELADMDGYYDSFNIKVIISESPFITLPSRVRG